MALKKQAHRRDTYRMPKAHSLANLENVIDRGPQKKLEVVLKCDSFGTCEAVSPILNKLKVPGVEVKVIQSGVGPVSKTDLLMALTGSRLVLGFSVGLMPKLEQWVKEQGVEVRLYNVIYKLADDLKKIAQSMTIPPEPEEKILGKAKVIALFKSTHRGIILGCQVLEGTLVAGKEFRVVAAMGPIYTGRIETLQVERTPIKDASAGQQVGIKVTDFSGAQIGDLVECFENVGVKISPSWKPSGNVIHLET